MSVTPRRKSFCIDLALLSLCCSGPAFTTTAIAAGAGSTACPAGEVEDLIADGMQFHFCRNTIRGSIRNNALPAATANAGGATAKLIDGVMYTTAGMTAIAGFRQRGHEYVQP